MRVVSHRRGGGVICAGKVVRSGPKPQTLTVTPALDRLPVFVRARIDDPHGPSTLSISAP
jgi:hypothetical protein